MVIDKQTIRMAYERLCKDSGYTFDYTKAANFVADLFHISVYEIWSAYSSIKVMEDISLGKYDK